MGPVLYHNLNRVGVEAIQVEHGDFFALYEKVPGKKWSPSAPVMDTSGMVLAYQGSADPGLWSSSSSISTPACQDLLLPSASTISNSRDQGGFADDQVWSPSHLQPGGIPIAPYPAGVRNYAETTPYQLQAELDDASVVSEDPKYGCEAGCLYCGQPCVRSKFGHVFHQCPEHYRWWRMHRN